MPNITHRKRLARLYARRSGLSYQAALAQVIAAAEAGRLPAHLDPAGISAALDILTAEPPVAAAAPSPTGPSAAAPGAPSGAPSGQPASLHRYYVDIPRGYAAKPHPLSVLTAEDAGAWVAVDTPGDQYAAQAAASRVLTSHGWGGVSAEDRAEDRVIAWILDHAHSVEGPAGCLGCQVSRADVGVPAGRTEAGGSRLPVVCRTDTLPPTRPSGPYPGRPAQIRTWTHEGPCRIGLGYAPAWHNLDQGTTYDGYWYLRRAIEWAEGLEEFEDLLTIVEPLLHRAETVQREIEVTAREKQALAEVINEATAYWQMCDYVHDEPGEDQVLGAMAESISGFYSSCCRQGADVTLTTADVGS